MIEWFYIVFVLFSGVGGALLGKYSEKIDISTPKLIAGLIVWYVCYLILVFAVN